MIIEKAHELGVMLSESAEFTRMTAAREALDANAEICAMLEDFNTRQHDLVDMAAGETEDGQSAVEVTRELEQMQDQIMANPLFAELMEAQNQFQTLLSQVNRVIMSCIGQDVSEEEGCGGDCSACHGCH